MHLACLSGCLTGNHQAARETPTCTCLPDFYSSSKALLSLALPSMATTVLPPLASPLWTLPVLAPAWCSLKRETTLPVPCALFALLWEAAPPRRAQGSRVPAAGSSGVFRGRSLGCEGGYF